MTPESLNKLTPAFFFQRFLENEDPDHITQFVHALYALQSVAVEEPYFLAKLTEEIKQQCGITPEKLEVGFSFFTSRDGVPFYNNGGFNITVTVNQISTMVTFCPCVEGYYHSYGEDGFMIQAGEMVTNDRDVLRWELARYIACYIHDVCDCIS